MYGAGQTFTKLDDSTFKYKECMEVVNGYRQASQGLSTWKDGDKLNELREQYKPQFEALPNCRHPF
ncbi:Uncharacterised protein [Moraxella lacunata]|uniref:Uncharacterized protein n=1 Tax=Moraxella lacunata TaxID=477 RepID=A0A378T5Y0_MORLA|nr:Uncharacterised protein [Moraxella lacunata]